MDIRPALFEGSAARFWHLCLSDFVFCFLKVLKVFEKRVFIIIYHVGHYSDSYSCENEKMEEISRHEARSVLKESRL